MVVSAIVNIRAPLFSENSKRFGLMVTLEEQKFLPIIKHSSKPGNVPRTTEE